MTRDPEQLLLQDIFSKQTKQFRMLFFENSNFLNFSSLDALNLISDPYSRSTAVNFMSRWGVGQLPSRFIPSLLQLKSDLEDTFAASTTFETATFLAHQKVSSYQILQPLITAKTLILKPPSFAFFPPTPMLIKNIPHCDDPYAHSFLLSLDPSRYDSIIILAESICSLSGKITSLKSLSSLAKKLNALLVVDDTNSFGLYGNRGRGLAASMGGIDLVYGSFAKTFGTYASYLLSSKTWKDYLLLTSPLSSKKTQLSPFILGFIKATLDLLPQLEYKRTYISRQANLFRDLFLKMGISFTDSNSHIIGLNFNSPLELKQFNFHLSENDVLLNQYKNSEDPNEKPTSRFLINSTHSTTQLQKLFYILKELKAIPYCEAL